MTSARSTDGELLRESSLGDERAFAAFVERHSGGVYQWALSLTEHPADAEDVLQETFLAAWRGASGFHGDESGGARAWLLTIARRVWLRARERAKQQYFVSHDDESLELLAERAGWGGVEREDDVRSDQLRAALARLTRDDRELLLLRDVEGWSSADVAHELDVSVAAMKSRLHRARLRLAAAYAQGEHDASTR